LTVKALVRSESGRAPKSTPSQKSAHVQEGQAAVLAFIAGYVDAYTFLNYRVSAAFMR
jgi:hypothetical protein